MTLRCLDCGHEQEAEATRDDESCENCGSGELRHIDTYAVDGVIVTSIETTVDAVTVPDDALCVEALADEMEEQGLDAEEFSIEVRGVYHDDA